MSGTIGGILEGLTRARAQEMFVWSLLFLLPLFDQVHSLKKKIVINKSCSHPPHLVPHSSAQSNKAHFLHICAENVCMKSGY